MVPGRIYERSRYHVLQPCAGRNDPLPKRKMGGLVSEMGGPARKQAVLPIPAEYPKQSMGRGDRLLSWWPEKYLYGGYYHLCQVQRRGLRDGRAEAPVWGGQETSCDCALWWYRDWQPGGWAVLEQRFYSWLSDRWYRYGKADIIGLFTSMQCNRRKKEMGWGYGKKGAGEKTETPPPQRRIGAAAAAIVGASGGGGRGDRPHPLF